MKERERGGKERGGNGEERRKERRAGEGARAGVGGEGV